MIATPGALRQYAHNCDNDVVFYRRLAQTASDADRKRYYERCADNREDDARWYREVIARSEIDEEWDDIEMMEAAE